MEEVLRNYIVLLWSYVFTDIDSLDWKVSLTEVFLYVIVSFGIVAIFKGTLVASLRRLLEKTDWSIAKYLMENNFFNRIVQLVPMMFLFTLVGNLEHPQINNVSTITLNVIFILLVGSVIFSILNSLEKVIENNKRMKELTFKPVFQLSKIVILAICIILSYSTITGKSPTTVLTMLGAVSAVLLLIFQETIRNFVAYIQITTFKLFKKGDWIISKENGADGEVIGLELNMVKVKNWDKTIVTMPTSACTSKSLINYANMSREGRRIKRAVNIDMNTISALTVEDMEKLSKINVLSEYMKGKTSEHNETNKNLSSEDLYLVNGKTLTNIGTFRKYLEHYLKNSEHINQKHTLLVRQLEATSEGLPIELYCFTNNTAWNHFEGVQSDIFDHIFTVLPFFGLSVFQQTSGQDFVKILNK
jgi:miniconductance mechanosensitive channel